MCTSLIIRIMATYQISLTVSLRRVYETSIRNFRTPCMESYKPCPIQRGYGVDPEIHPGNEKKGTGLKENREVGHINRQTNDGAMPVPGWVPLKQE